MELKIRLLIPEDIPKLREIHSNFFAEEFEFPNFDKDFICAFVVMDKDDNIISGGGIRRTIEATLLTDKKFTVKDRRSALFLMLETCEYISKKSGYDKLHAVTENDNWREHLSKVGFHSRGNCLVLDL